MSIWDVSGSVEVENRNGLVELRTKAPLGNIDINNVHGGIQVDMPSASNFQLDAQSMGGNIESDFSVNVDNRGRDATAQGTVGKGGNVVRLNATTRICRLLLLMDLDRPRSAFSRTTLPPLPTVLAP